MARCFLYVPFPQELVAASEDGYVLGMIEAFRAAGNPENQVLYPSAELTWTTTKPSGEDLFVTPVKKSVAMQKFAASTARTIRTTSYLKRVQAGQAQSLSQVSASDMLFVLGHSSYEGGYLTLKQSVPDEDTLDLRRIRVDMLATLLHTDGLSSLHKYIKLNSCYGGGSDALDRAFAKDLALMLRQRGHPVLKVGGYQFLMTVDRTANALSLTAPKTLSFLNPTLKPEYDKSINLTSLAGMYAPENNPMVDVLMYERDPYRVWFDGNGACVRWNAPDGAFGVARGRENLSGLWEEKVSPILADDDAHFEKWEEKKKAEMRWLRRLKWRVE
jgi:hypothetical protein